MDALHMRVLRGLAGLDMDHLDLPLDTPSQKMATGQFGAVVAANGPRFATLLDDFVQHACHAPAGEAGVHFQCETLARKCIDHAQHPDRSTCCDRIVHKIQSPFLVGGRVMAQGCALSGAVLPLFRPSVSPASRYTRWTRLWFNNSPERRSSTCNRRYPKRGF